MYRVLDCIVAALIPSFVLADSQFAYATIENKSFSFKVSIEEIDFGRSTISTRSSGSLSKDFSFPLYITIYDEIKTEANLKQVCEKVESIYDPFKADVESSKDILYKIGDIRSKCGAISDINTWSCDDNTIKVNTAASVLGKVLKLVDSKDRVVGCDILSRAARPVTASATSSNASKHPIFIQYFFMLVLSIWAS
jgi:hypothetical protein